MMNNDNPTPTRTSTIYQDNPQNNLQENFKNTFRRQNADLSKVYELYDFEP